MMLLRSQLKYIGRRLLSSVPRSVVTLVEAKAMPKTYNTMSNDVLITMAVMGDQEAREEVLFDSFFL